MPTPDPAAVLHRLRTDVPAEEILADPPPIPERIDAADTTFILRRADPEADATLVATWMNRPHLVETWEQPWPEERWKALWRAQLKTTYSVPVIASYQGAEACYLEIYRPHRDEIAGCYSSLPHDLGIHIAVGDPALTGRGIFSALMGRLAEALLDADPHSEAVLIEPDYRNHRIHSAARKLGWHDCGERQQRPNRRVRLFVRPRGALPERFLDA